MKQEMLINRLNKRNERILYYGLSDNLGGIETYLYSLSKNNSDLQKKIDYLVTSKTVCFEEHFNLKGSKIYKIPNRRPNPFKFYWSLFKFFKNHKEYRIVHFFLQSASCIEPVILAKIFGKKVIVDSRSSYKGSKKITKFLHRINRRIVSVFTDEKLAISKSAGKSMFESDFKIINSGIEANNYTFNKLVRKKYREELQLQQKFVLGHIGRFAWEKNHEFLIDIFKEVHRRKPNSVLLLIGDGAMINEIKQKVIAMELNDCVIFLGERSDVPELLQVMDIFVFPSHFEGLGRVLVEAQASGLKTVISEKIPEEVRITNLVTTLSLNSLSEWVETILLQVSEYERLNMYQNIVDKGFDIQNSLERLVCIYMNLLNSGDSKIRS